MNQSEYQTKDLYLSVILKSCNIPLIKIESNGRHSIFIFKNGKEIEKIIADYFNNQLRLDPRILFETFKGLKSQAFSAAGNVR